jgi:hypothetical protein
MKEVTRHCIKVNHGHMTHFTAIDPPVPSRDPAHPARPNPCFTVTIMAPGASSRGRGGSKAKGRGRTKTRFTHKKSTGGEAVRVALVRAHDR